MPLEMTMQSRMHHISGSAEMMGERDPFYIAATLLVPCRKCTVCRVNRSRMWTARCLAEHDHAPRSWFVTLTFRPGFWAGCTDDHAERASAEVTKALKRLRKAGAVFRYMLVTELHKSGLPHLHLIIHDQGGVTWRAINTAWTAGFHVSRLITDRRAVAYTTKYLQKGYQTRIRASLHYGEGSPHGRGSDASPSLADGESLHLNRDEDHTGTPATPIADTIEDLNERTANSGCISRSEGDDHGPTPKNVGRVSRAARPASPEGLPLRRVGEPPGEAQCGKPAADIPAGISQCRGSGPPSTAPDGCRDGRNEFTGLTGRRLVYHRSVF